nr:ATP-binding protein [Brevibacillus sp. SYP-B805]
MVRQLAESRSHKEHVISSVQDGIVTLDVNGRVTEWNPAMENITGIPAAEVLGRPYPEVYRHAPEFESLLMQTWETGIEQKAIDSYFPRRDGRRVPVNSSTSLLKNGEKVMGALLVMRDLTEKQLAEEQIRRSDRLRAVGELAAGMAHEIRNPLTSIKAFAQILEDGFPEHESNNRTYTKVIIEEVERINRIVERLLLFAKPSPLRQAVVPFSSIVMETLPLVESECRRKGIRLSFDAAEEAEIAVDPELIRQVLLNLLLNAVQATPAEGEIRIRVEAGEEAASLHLFNEGEPIPEEHKERIFNPFFSTKEKGVGLGLSVSQSIVRLYQGSLTFRNEPNGVTFTVSIPRTDSERKGEVIGEGTSRHSGGRR